MLQTTFLVQIRKGRIIPTQTRVHNCNSCEQLLPCPLTRGSYPPKHMYTTTNVANDFSHALLALGKYGISELKCTTAIAVNTLTKRKSHSTKVKSKTPHVADYSYAHQKGGGRTHSKYRVQLRLFQKTFVMLISKGAVLPT